MSSVRRSERHLPLCVLGSNTGMVDLGASSCLLTSSRISLGGRLPFDRGDIRGLPGNRTSPWRIILGLKRSTTRTSGGLRLGSDLTMVARQLVVNYHFS